MLVSADNHVFPAWAPDWLRDQVASPDCSSGTHPCLRMLAKWLVIYFAEHEGEAERWLRHAAAYCDRDVPDDEVDRLLIWAEGIFGQPETTATKHYGSSFGRPQVDLEELYEIAVSGPLLAQYRESSPQQ